MAVAPERLAVPDGAAGALGPSSHQLQASVVASQLPLQQSPSPPHGMPMLRQHRFPEVVTLLFVQTAPVGC